MTLLMFSHSEKSVVVVMDTLATSPTGEPYLFMSKVTPFPHANMLVAGTGLASVLIGWVNYLSTRCIFRDLTGAGVSATETLQRLFADAIGDEEGAFWSTIYHFGFESGSDRAVRYIYRSTNDFREERIERPGFGVKPTIDDVAPYGPANTVEELVALAERVRKEQEERGAEHIYVGGELFMTIITPDVIQSTRIHTFGDFDSDWTRAMLGSSKPFV